MQITLSVATMSLRVIYSRSELFNTQKTVRSIDGPVKVNDSQALRLEEI